MGFSIGRAVNSLTGASSAASQANKYALWQGAVNNAYQKEAAQNAHQWEMEDLKKAGLNPALTATGGAGASLSGGGMGSGSPATNGNPFEIINSMVGMANQTSATESQNALNEDTGLANLINAIANYNQSTSNVDKNKGGLISNLVGTEFGNALIEKAKQIRIKRTKTSTTRQEKNKKLSKELPYFKRLFYVKTEKPNY